MRVAVTGASGNVGSRVVEHLLQAGVDDLVGVVRRPPESGWPEQVHWTACDVGIDGARSLLTGAFAGVDAVVHLAWQIQPARDEDRMRRTNLDGSRQVFAAAVDAGVPAIVYASSVGAYSPGPKDTAVDESWPTDGIPTSTYSRHKAAVERLLDEVEAQRPGLRVVRFRPGLIFQAAAASEIARYFLGPFVPLSALQRRLLPVLPAFDRLVFQAVHTDDVARAYTRAVLDPDVRGAFNLAADPVIDAQVLARTLRARPVTTPPGLVRAAADIAFRARLQPTDAGWFDLAMGAPVMSTARARSELNWSPQHTSTGALLELLDGLRHGLGGPSPVLRPAADAAGRLVTAVRSAVRGGAGAQNP
jgi:UDP-glucose 4-epimerase